MIISRKKPALSTASQPKQSTSIDSLENYIGRRDFTGAMTLLQLVPTCVEDKRRDMWLAYCSYHLGDYEQAGYILSSLTKNAEIDDLNVWTYLACCYFMLGLYYQATNALENAPVSPLQNRLGLHLSHKLREFSKRLEYMDAMKLDNVEDQMSLAALRFLERNYDEAINAYRQLIVENRQYLAINVYIALCFYKKEYYELSQEVLSIYLKQHPQSVIAVNLEACNLYHLHSNGQIAKETLEKFLRSASSDLKFAKEIIDHNMVVFQDGEGAAQVLPALIGVVPEAKQNLIITYLNNGEADKAFELVQDFEPMNLQEYILVAAVYTTIGQDIGSIDLIEKAIQYFRLATTSETSETVLGREALASTLFLLKQYPEAIEVFDSIKSYFINDDRFNFNYGQTKMALGLYREAIEALVLIRSTKIKNDLVYRYCVIKSYIMAGKAALAFEFFGQMEVTTDSLLLLNILAHLCYKTGQFLASAKSFDLLERLHMDNKEIWEGKRGACIGLFQQIIAGQEPKIHLTEIVALLKTSPNPQAVDIIRIIRNWTKQNRELSSNPFFNSSS